MAFGFNDFAKFFDPVSDLLGTSGKKGVGLLQQKPEDIAMTAAAIYLATNGIPVTPESVAAVETATATGTAEAAAAEAAAKEAARLAAEQAAAEATRLAAQESAKSGIMQGAQMDPQLLADVNAKGIDVASNSTDFLKDFGGREGALTPREAFPDVENFYDKNQLAEYGANRYQPSSGVGNYGINYTKPPIPEVGSNVSYNLTGGDTFRTAGDTNLSTSLPQSKVGLSDPTANIGNRLPTTQGDYTQTESALDKGMRKAGEYFDKASDYVDKNPYKSAGLAYFGASKLGLLDQPSQEPIADDYKNPYSMANFRRTSPNPSAYQYAPRYAEGGIASVQGYAKGGRSKAESAMDFYDAMNPQQESAPLSHGSPGIYYDTDPDTRYLDPMEAAMVRMSKLNSRANVQAPAMTPARRMGELNFKPVAAAQGGIMGFADGGDIPTYYEELYKLNGRGGGGRTKEDPDAKFSPTSEGAAAVSQFGQRMSNYPAMAPLGLGAKVVGAIASAYGDHMARNVNPNYSNEGRQQMQAAQSVAQDGRIAAHDAMRSNEGVNSVTSGGGSSDATPATDHIGYGREGQHAAQGGIMGYNLGGYAAGGNPRLLRGPGDGMSDHIPATINNRQPARLADGEYVITADVVSHLGNGSTEAGARQLDAMMKRIRKGRTGTPKQGKQINPRKYLPA